MKKFILLLFVILVQDASARTRALSCKNPQGDIACMTCNCFNEAAGQSYAGQVAVGKVVKSRMYLNQLDREKNDFRKPRYESTVCGVIKEKYQFSWYNKLRTRAPVPFGHPCFKAAQESLAFEGFFADHYHANYVRPRWARNMQVVGRDEPNRRNGAYHIFYNAAGIKQTPQKDESSATVALNERS
ncbi:cell wall hydrolase [bacterium]|nr:cell wall hydrolase [bacterium]